MRFDFLLFKTRKRRLRYSPHRTLYVAHKESARGLVQERLRFWCTVYPFEYGQVRIKNHRRSWGSCSSKKNLNFNWRIATLSPELADYVILHELCHTVHLNHSKLFWEFMLTFNPNISALRSRLRVIPVH